MNAMTTLNSSHTTERGNHMLNLSQFFNKNLPGPQLGQFLILDHRVFEFNTPALGFNCVKENLQVAFGV